jgi:hypothetical protein
MTRSRSLTELYAANEALDGYFRDRCVFAPDIDIEDLMQAQIAYANGVVANYLLTANNPGEGYAVAFHGDRGVLTLETIERPHVREDGRLVRPELPETSRVTLHPLFREAVDLAIPAGEGSHGGGDTVMLQHLFGQATDDPFDRAADERAGAWAALVGIAANASIATGAEIALDDLAGDIPKPEPRVALFGAEPPWTTFDPAAYAFMADATPAAT